MKNMDSNKREEILQKAMDILRWDNPSRDNTLNEVIAAKKIQALVLEYAAPQNVGGPKDWAEDFSHENGNYQNVCMYCEEVFLGHKRRVICKQCWAQPARLRVMEFQDQSIPDRFYTWEKEKPGYKSYTEWVTRLVQNGDIISKVKVNGNLFVRAQNDEI